MIIVFISALVGSLGVVIDKIILSRRHLSVHIFAPLQFLLLFLVSAALVPWLGRFDVAQALNLRFLALFILMIVVAGAWNIFYYRAVKNESLQEVELVVLFTPLVTALLSAALLAQERDPQILLAALVASLALIAAHLKRQHLQFDYYSRWLLVAVVLGGFESIVIKQLLEVWSPAALYMARTFYVFLFFYFLVRPHFEHLSPKSMVWVLLSAIVGVVFMITKLYGYQNLGIVFTTLVLALQPSATLLLDKLVLHEKLQLKYIMAIVVVIGAVVYGTLAR